MRILIFLAETVFNYFVLLFFFIGSMFAHLMSGKVIILFTAAQQNLGLLLALSSGGKTGVW